MNKESVTSALKDLCRWQTIVVLLLTLLWAYKFQWLEQEFPFLLTAQLKFHQLLSNLDWRQQRVNWVTLVQIDDDSFWSTPLSGILPTNRAVLADVGLLAAEHGALVVAFDIQLKSPSPVPGDDKIRDHDNKHLLDVIRKITGSNKPVVLTIGLVPNDKGEWEREPNIFKDDELPPGTRLGQINLPIDPRQIPLDMTAWELDKKSKVSLDSFALKIVDSYEEANHLHPRTKDQPVIAEAIADNEYVYGGFLRKSAWARVTAKQLLQGDKQALGMCRNRVVIIGSTWHEFGNSRGPAADEHVSPIGPVPGLYLHGNYVEALLSGNFRAAVPEKFAVLIDLGIAVLLYVLFRSATGKAMRVKLLLAFVLPLLAAYVAFANVGRYLDYIAPVSLVFVHLFVESRWPEGLTAS
ncbi:MAG: CHASE2 domain-containing protein [Candidatus Sulfotelmatobacter sp.]